MKAMVVLFLALTLMFPISAETAPAQQLSAPLLLAGKQALHQRVLIRPGAKLYSSANTASGFILGKPFSIYYVYVREKIDNADWVQISSNRHGTQLVWCTVDQIIEWKQTLTVAFREPISHDRVLLFRDRDVIAELAKQYDVFKYHSLYRSAEQGTVGPDSPIIGIQPKTYVDIKNDFYLVPILQHEDIFLNNSQGLLLQVATVPQAQAQQQAPITQPPQPPKVADYRSGIVFVIDSTKSMGPYIERTRKVVRDVYESIKKAGLESKVSFGLVAYRDNIDVVPSLEYLTKTYATLIDGINPDSFFDAVKNVEAATASSRGFNEDAFAGIKTAIEEIDWQGIDARYLVLVTDAGARSSDDLLAATKMGAGSLHQLAFDQAISLFVLHLRTPAGVNNHKFAQEQYQRLAHYPQIGDFYYGVEMGDVNAFGEVLERLTAQITRQVSDAANRTPVTPPASQLAATTDPLAMFQEKVEKLGNALRMRYLQKLSGEKLPTLFNAWVLDRDFVNPQNATLDVRVLLTRNQLSDLTFVLQRILETAEEGLLSPDSFLNELKSVAAAISRNPNAVNNSTQTTSSTSNNLADLGYMREYIEDLPYKGEVMQLRLDNWQDLPAQQQLDFLHRIEDKINYYQAVHDNTDLWISLDGSPISGDAVFPMALEMLP